MNNQRTIGILASVIVVSAIGAFVYSASSKKDVNDNLNNTNNAISEQSKIGILDSLNESHADAVLVAAVDPQIEDWSKYNVDENYHLSWSCSGNDKQNIFYRLNETTKVQMINGVLPIILTQNIEQWSLTQTETLSSQTYDDDCGVGKSIPIYADNDRILWVYRCVSGAWPETTDSDYVDSIKCLQTEEVIVDHFGIEPWD